ncbi:MAG: MBL fold metallo-hydrolase [Nanoarchaeota archaeon]|nr:MBL fold metallo-hydrolase [Nanoarchaeota archaeon]
MDFPFSLYFIGHAGFMLEYNNLKLLCDPWVSDSGAFLHSWHQFPPNDFIDKTKLYDADYLYVSHMHCDHFDKEFLRIFPKEKVTLIIADFLSDTFYHELTKLGFPRIITLQDWEKYTLGENFSVMMFKDQSLYKIDSLVLIDIAGKKILNKNDCHLSEVYFEKFREQKIDLLLAQFSGAMWYPAVYDYDDIRKNIFSAKIKKNLLDSFVALANGVAAKNIIHYAGPPCFLEEQFFKFNFQEQGIFHDQQDVFQRIQEQINGKLHLLHPSDTIKLTQDGTVNITRERNVDFSRKKELLHQYQQRRKPIIESYLRNLKPADEKTMATFENHLAEIFSSNRYIKDKVNALIRFTVTGKHGGDIFVDTRYHNLTISRSSTENAHYSFTLQDTIVQVLVDGTERWEDLLLSMRFQAKRNPDLYNWPLFALLLFSKEPKLLARIEQMMRDNEKEKIMVRDGTTQYEIQRFCPHAGEDLRNAIIKNGRLVCPRHQWTFDLRSKGECVFGGNMPLKIYAEFNDEEEGQI